MSEGIMESPPFGTAELARRSLRIRFKSPSVALGLFGSENPADPNRCYWKWNLAENRFRITPIERDRRLDMRDIWRLPHPEIRILSYKPESRVTWRVDRGTKRVVRKHYAISKFEHRARTALCFASLAGDRAPRLYGIDLPCREIEWQWIEPNRRMPDIAPTELASLVRPLHGADCSETIASLPEMNPEAIWRHLEQRLKAVAVWQRILETGPERHGRLRKLATECRQLGLELATWDECNRPCLLHGDLRDDNILRDEHGRLRLLDSDHLAVGAVEWDYAAWLADRDRLAPEARDIEFERFAALPSIDARRLKLYFRCWRMLNHLQSFEEPGL